MEQEAERRQMSQTRPFCDMPRCNLKAKKKILTPSGKSTDLCDKHVERAKKEGWFTRVKEEYK
jgi:hypothetical protein